MKSLQSISRRHFIKKAVVTAGLTTIGADTLFGKSILIPDETSFDEALLTGLDADPSAIKALSLPESAYRSRFDMLMKYKWKTVFKDSGRGDWHEKWFLDGDRAKVENSSKGMTLHAGPTHKSEADHAVLWTKEVFEAEYLKIEYNFTRIDDKHSPGTVNIIYILAQGGAGKPLDILEWADERREPNMGKYYNLMHTYHVSYAVMQELTTPPEQDKYIRGRRYSASGLNGTELTPEYMNVPLFEPGVTYKMTFIKTGVDLLLRVTGHGKQMVFYFDTTKFPTISKGRIGLRQMYTRVSRYSDFKIGIGTKK